MKAGAEELFCDDPLTFYCILVMNILIGGGEAVGGCLLNFILLAQCTKFQIH